MNGDGYAFRQQHYEAVAGLLREERPERDGSRWADGARDAWSTTVLAFAAMFGERGAFKRGMFLAACGFHDDDTRAEAAPSLIVRDHNGNTIDTLTEELCDTDAEEVGAVEATVADSGVVVVTVTVLEREAVTA